MTNKELAAEAAREILGRYFEGPESEIVDAVRIIERALDKATTQMQKEHEKDAAALKELRAYMDKCRREGIAP